MTGPRDADTLASRSWLPAGLERGTTVAFTIGLDTGGTFTDVMALDEDGGTISAKVPSTPGRVAGVVDGLEVVAGRMGVSLADLLARAERFVYGTTVATNAILERSGDGRVGCLVTKGFRDTLFLRRGIRRSIWDCQEPFPEPFVRRAHTREVPERVDAEGGVVVPLDLEAARGEIEALLAEQRLVDGAIDALAVCFIHAYAHPDHERQVAELIRGEHPGVFVSASVDVAPEIRTGVGGEHARSSRGSAGRGGNGPLPRNVSRNVLGVPATSRKALRCTAPRRPGLVRRGAIPLAIRALSMGSAGIEPATSRV
jgi:Hydantoinase/oxoprolinase N-terminal region